MFPAVNNGVMYGYNRFRYKPFAAKDSTVTFFLRGNLNAQRVMLAGSFNNWVPTALRMNKSDSGWIAFVNLGPGKYWYKFIVDGNWTIDHDNMLMENDGLGNINSVYYKPNVLFSLNSYTSAKKVYLAGSFNNWQPRDLLMNKTPSGWEIALYLPEGTHTYRFVADGVWFADPSNNNKFPNEYGDYNSVIRIGKPHIFKLSSYTNARQVVLAGSFNRWRDDELFMRKTPTGWELPYTLGGGNYEYKFKVDGNWLTDPANPPTSNHSNKNSYLIIDPNYTFRLKGFSDAKKVFISGDFINWNPEAFLMKREGNGWVFDVHLSTGKHLYKFIVDGRWIIDPSNPLWEQNQYGTGNSIIWIANK
jgi:1,4-alpha-glucan branching enzyme